MNLAYRWFYRLGLEDRDGNVIGSCDYTGMQPKMLEKARYHNLDRALMQALHGANANQNDRSQAA